MKVLDLFSGIGGFSLGLERAGFETIAFCEIDKKCQQVLKKHWPNVPIYDDVRKLDAETLRKDGVEPDIICGGFPCQDISIAGKKAGINGERSGLWADFFRLISELRPRYTILENSSNLFSGGYGAWIRQLFGQMASIGYNAEGNIISAAGIGALHLRERAYILAYPDEFGRGNDTARKPGCSSGKETEEIRSSATDKVARSGSGSTIMADSDRHGCNEMSERFTFPSGSPRSADEFQEVPYTHGSRELQSKGIFQDKWRRPCNCSAEKSNQIPNTPGERSQNRFGKTTGQETISEPERLYSQVSNSNHINDDDRRYGTGPFPIIKKAHVRQSEFWAIEPEVGRMVDGFPGRVDQITQLGNAVLPQIPELIGIAINDFEAGLSCQET